MPHKDREARLQYLREWKLRKRPRPQVAPQPDKYLPANGAIEFSADGTKVRCHACGQWLGSLNSHLRVHGLDARSYKELYDLARTSSLWPPALKEQQREAAIDRGQGEIGRDHLPLTPGRPKGLKQRLSVRIEASAARASIYTRGGERTKGDA